MLRVKLKEYLARLESLEQVRPADDRREVPTLTELADAVGVTRATMSAFVNNRQVKLDVEMIGKILEELRSRGFDTNLNDVLAYDADDLGELPPAYLELAVAG